MANTHGSPPPDHRSPIIVFATYWNEIKFIHASLEQLDAINPVEAIICDGCFDPSRPNRSDDGTREVIEAFVAQRPHMRMIQALRLSPIQHLFHWFRRLPHETTTCFSWAKLRMLPTVVRCDLYRLNQMATFNHMLTISNVITPGRWFMTYDSDQFYEDSMIDLFRRIETQRRANIITANELTFFGDFYNYTPDYEKRDYNNMPHRIFSDTRFIPTRHPARIHTGRFLNCSDFEPDKMSGGFVYHYHLRGTQRELAGYDLGDRRPPDPTRTRTRRYEGRHPSIIQRRFLASETP